MNDLPLHVPSTASHSGIERLPAGIAGFDDISEGGLPVGRATLVAGSAGSGKTLFAMQFLVAGLERFGEPGVVVTFEETPEDLVRNVASFGWDLASLREQNKLAVVDASPTPGQDLVESGSFDLSALMARIEDAVRRVGAKRVSIDSIGAMFSQFSDANTVRREIQRILAGLRALGVTSVVTAERTAEHGYVARFGVEEFIADNVVILRNTLEQEKRRRTVEVLKIRGGSHQKGEYAFTIEPHSGLVVMPLSSIELTQRSSESRISSGNPELDRMCGGGMYRDSVILVSGATGTGKTLMVTEFMKGAMDAGDRGLIFAFEESREQLFRNALSWGVDYAEFERRGLLKVVCRYPETTGVEDHLISIKRDIEEFRPDRVAVDSLSALERVSSEKSFREFAIGITSHIKHKETAGLFTNTTSSLLGSPTITESHMSTITDMIILLRYVELLGEMRRGITVLKMRGSWHDKQIREFGIDGNGMHIREPFRGINGILAGTPTYTFLSEKAQVDQLFDTGRDVRG